MSPRRYVVVAVAALALATPAQASASVTKQIFTENSTGVSPMDAGDGLAGCVGYSGLVYEARHGVWKLTIGKRDGHVEGVVDATFRIFPKPGQSGVVYRGTYVEHSVGRFVPGRDGDMPHPMAMYQLRGRGVGSDGSILRFHEIGQTQIDLRTGSLKRDRFSLGCTVA